MSPRDGTLDLVVVGAGPAGLAAAVIARSLGLSARVFEQAATAGGQLLGNPTPIPDCPGVEAPTGPALAAGLRAHVDRAGAVIDTGVAVHAVDLETGRITTNRGAVDARFVILATGVRPRTLGVPGERAEHGRGPWPAARAQGERYRGLPVVVIGGGDVALEEAAIFAQRGARVTLVHRGTHLAGRADFRAAVVENPAITVLTGTSLVGIEGEAAVTGARVVRAEETWVIPAAGVFICAGSAPNSELFAAQVETDPYGFVVTDVRQRTSATRGYAAGDVCAMSAWSVAAALGQAAAAVKDIERRVLAAV